MKTVCQLIFAFSILLLFGCKTPPIEAPLSQVGKVYVVASSSGGNLGNPGLDPSAVGAAEQAFTEVLIQRGYRVVKKDGPSSIKDCSHYFEVVVNQAFVEQSSSRKYLHIDVSSKLIDAKTKDIMMARSLPPSFESSKQSGVIVRLVKQMASKVALLYPPARLDTPTAP